MKNHSIMKNGGSDVFPRKNTVKGYEFFYRKRGENEWITDTAVNRATGEVRRKRAVYSTPFVFGFK